MSALLNNLWHRLLTGWNFVRILRTGMAFIIIIEAWKSSELLFALLGGFLAFQAAFIYGCRGLSGCGTDQGKNPQRSSGETGGGTTFEEVE